MSTILLVYVGNLLALLVAVGLFAITLRPFPRDPEPPRPEPSKPTRDERRVEPHHPPPAARRPHRARR